MSELVVFLQAHFSEILTGASFILLLWVIPDVILMLVVNIDRSIEMDNEQIEELEKLLKQTDKEQEHE